VTLTAMTAPLPIAAEVEIPSKRLMATGVIVAVLLFLPITSTIVVAVWDTSRLLPKGLSPYPLVLPSTYDYRDDLEYCPSPDGYAMTWPLSLQLHHRN
jgi:hypothetical protein